MQIKKHKIGIIGAGIISDIHCQAFLNTLNCEILAIADTQYNLAQEKAIKYSIKNIYDNYLHIIEDKDINVVDITTPHHLHYSITLQALQAGKDVICEKPIALNIQQAEEIIRLAKALKRKVYVKMYQRYASHHAIMKQYIQEERMGKPFLSTGILVTQQRADMNDESNWRGTWDKAGGGVLIDIGIHWINLMRYFFGEIKSVSATSALLVTQAKNKSEDTSLLTLEFKNNVLAQLICTNVDSSLKQMTWQKGIYGTESSLHTQTSESHETLIEYKKGQYKTLATINNWWAEANILALKDILENLENDNEDQGEDLCSMYSALEDVNIIQTAYKSSETGSRIIL